MTNKIAMTNFARDVVLMKQCNVNPIVVHGGGPMISTFLKKMNIESKFIKGKRVTSEEAITAVEMVLTGNINKSIVSAIMIYLSISPKTISCVPITATTSANI